MGLAIHQEAAGAADALAAVVLEADRALAGPEQAVVEFIEGLQQREIDAELLQPVALEAARLAGASLAPHLQGEADRGGNGLEAHGRAGTHR